MRGRFVAKRAWLWAGLGIALGLGIVPYTGRPREARATQGPELEARAGETIATARALVAQLEAELHSIESSLSKARELLARLEGQGSHRQPASAVVAHMKNATGEDLVGFWRLVGLRKAEGDQFHEPPYVLYRIMTPSHFMNFDFDPNTGKVLDWTGGTYSLKDGTYTGHYDYSNSEAVRAIVGREYQFTSKIAGDWWHHTGTVPNGMRFDDLYERINKPRVATPESEGPHRLPAPTRGASLRNATGEDLVGIWHLAGLRKAEGDEFHNPPHELYKFMTPDRYLFISFDPNTGKVLDWAGGTYSLKDGTYAGHVEFTNREGLRSLGEKEYKLTYKLEGDRWCYRAGTLPNGERLDDVWERINRPR